MQATCAKAGLKGRLSYERVSGYPHGAVQSAPWPYFNGSLGTEAIAHFTTAAVFPRRLVQSESYIAVSPLIINVRASWSRMVAHRIPVARRIVATRATPVSLVCFFL